MLLQVPIPTPIPAPPLPDAAPQSSGDPSSMLVANTNESVQAPQGASLALPAQLPTPEVNTLANRLSFDGVVSRSSANTKDFSDTTPLSLPAETSPSLAEGASPSPQDQGASNVSSVLQTDIASRPMSQSIDQPVPFVASSETPVLPREQTEFSAAAQSGVTAPSATSTFADLVSIAPQAPETPEPNTSSSQRDSATESQRYSQMDMAQSGVDEVLESVEPDNAAPASFFSPMLRKGDQKQPAAAPLSPAILSSTAKQNPTLAQILRSALQTPQNEATLRPAVEPVRGPGGELVPEVQPDHSSPTLSSLPPTSAVNSGNSSMGPSSNKSQHNLGQTGGSGAVEAPAAVQTAAANSTPTIGSQPSSSLGTPPDSQSRAATPVNASTNAPSMSAQPAATAATGSGMPGATPQPAMPASTHKSENNSAASSADLPSNLQGLRESPASPATGPVQMAQIMSRAAQSEMRIGLNTSAFGNVEVRTVVHANEVGVLIGSEKGDLRSLLSNELPSIANTLQQQNLRLNQVSFHQQGFAFSSQTSSGNHSQQRSFASRPVAITALPAAISNAESDDPASPARSRGLSILA
jgi:hypothetical protein